LIKFDNLIAFLIN